VGHTLTAGQQVQINKDVVEGRCAQVLPFVVSSKKVDAAIEMQGFRGRNACHNGAVFRSTVLQRASSGVGRVGRKGDGPAWFELCGAIDAVANHFIVTAFISSVQCSYVRSNLFAGYKVEIVHVLANQSGDWRRRSKERVPHFAKYMVECKLIVTLTFVIIIGSMVIILMTKGHYPFG
jgi:hypothetical protein